MVVVRENETKFKVKGPLLSSMTCHLLSNNLPVNFVDRRRIDNLSRRHHRQPIGESNQFAESSLRNKIATSTISRRGGWGIGKTRCQEMAAMKDLESATAPNTPPCIFIICNAAR